MIIRDAGKYRRGSGRGRRAEGMECVSHAAGETEEEDIHDILGSEAEICGSQQLLFDLLMHVVTHQSQHWPMYPPPESYVVSPVIRSS